jgi:hypothetical protein
VWLPPAGKQYGAACPLLPAFTTCWQTLFNSQKCMFKSYVDTEMQNILCKLAKDTTQTYSGLVNDLFITSGSSEALNIQRSAFADGLFSNSSNWKGRLFFGGYLKAVPSCFGLNGADPKICEIVLSLQDDKSYRPHVIQLGFPLYSS